MKDLLKSLIAIFRYAGRFLTLVRNTVFNIFFVLLIIIGIAVFFTTKRAPFLPDNSILVLTLSGDIVEEKQPVSAISQLLDEMDNGTGEEAEILLQDILHIIDRASADDRIAALLLDMEKMGSAGIDQLQVIGQALDRFRATSKKVVAAEDYYSQRQYYLASFADTVAINPMGGVDLHGFGAYSLYFKEALDKLKINYHVFRVGTFKSAIEPIVRDSMSPEARQQAESWLTSLWDSYTADIIKHRSLNPAMLVAYTHTPADLLRDTGGDIAKLALKAGLVDKIWTRNQVEAHLASLAGTSSDRDYTHITSKDYLAMIGSPFAIGSTSENKIGILVAQGAILPGKQPPGLIGGDSLAALIREARKDASIKALVLRINSGGGSAFASEIIRQELLELKKSGKPLVVSMGTVAASGGYWIAADADQIWAAPTTLTGSIGIFGVIPTFENSLAELGIRSDGTGTTPMAAGLDLSQPLSPQLKETIQLSVEHGYRQFLSIVGNGRKIGGERLSSIAEGRVFDGRTAQKIGLVDRLGSLQDAVQAAAKLAKVSEDYAPSYIQKPRSMKEQLLEELTSKSMVMFRTVYGSSSFLAGIFRQFVTSLDGLPMFSDPRGVYALSLLPKAL
jgi:protease IV